MIRGVNISNVYVDECVDIELTPHEERRELQRKRKESVKARDLDRRTKRQDKRRQAY